MKNIALLCALLLSLGGHSLACECRISGKVSKYLNAADIVFVGRVVFTDDDGSGTFKQRTFVRFEIEEQFKGLEIGVRDVWADPGSFTSCYAKYDSGERYLVFAYRGAKMPVATSSVMAAPDGHYRKPVPAGIDAANPPPLYYAPECTGTLPITAETQTLVDSWLKELKKYNNAK
jgi:hypothetical protein